MAPPRSIVKRLSFEVGYQFQFSWRTDTALGRRSNGENQRRKTNGYSGSRVVDVFTATARRRRAKLEGCRGGGPAFDDDRRRAALGLEPLGVTSELRVAIDAHETCSNHSMIAWSVATSVCGDVRRLRLLCFAAPPPPLFHSIVRTMGSVRSAAEVVQRDTGNLTGITSGHRYVRVRPDARRWTTRGCDELFFRSDAVPSCPLLDEHWHDTLRMWCVQKRVRT